MNCGGSYIDSPDWIKDKKARINLTNKKHNKSFQYAVTVVLNHEEIGKYSERTRKIKSLINKYNREGIDFMLKKKKIYPAYISKHNSDLVKQVILLNFPNG